MKKKLLEWVKSENMLAEEQGGFQAGQLVLDPLLLASCQKIYFRSRSHYMWLLLILNLLWSLFLDINYGVHLRTL